MAIFSDMPSKLRNMFDEGLDEVLIFAIIFVLILISGNETSSGDNMGILPLLIIGAFLLLFLGTCRAEEEMTRETTTL
ncbi:MAG: hypothetical protein GX279_01870 [Clostridiaceae bacterium]|nr:hypothetical protein [Clostridiaceae bacterium]